MIKPLWEYVLIERENLKTTILIPEESQKRHMEAVGVVMAVGDRAEDFIQDLVGKRVVFKQHAGNWMKIDGDEFFPIHQDDILAVAER